MKPVREVAALRADSGEAPGSRRTTIQRVSDGSPETRDDWLAVEAPVEIRVVSGPEGNRRETRIAVTMRTPGADAELAVGYLASEGLLHGGDEIARVEQRGEDVVVVHLTPATAFDATRLQRTGVMSSSCGVCGKSALDMIAGVADARVSRDDVVVDADVLKFLPESLRQAQANFSRTGGLHAAGLFSRDGTLILLREDVGRHNALDKLAGRVLLDGIATAGTLLLLSGRASYELIQKALACAIPVVAAIGAPSSLAVDLATEHGLTLVGFLRRDGFNVYAGGRRIGATGRLPHENSED